MKRVLSAILVCTMMFTVCAAAGLENFKSENEYTAGQFSDVAESAWYNESVKSAYELGLVKGNSETTFNPEGEITIAETLVLACRLHSIYNDGGSKFEQGSPWYQVYVNYAIDKGIITDGSYEDYSIKAERKDFAQIMSKSLPSDAFEKINNVEFIPDVAEWETYAEQVFMLYNAGILTGSDEKGTFNASSTIKRSEVAAIVTRIALPEQRKEITLPEATDEQLQERLKAGAFSAAYCINLAITAMEDGYEKQDVNYYKSARLFFEVSRIYVEATEKIADKLGSFSEYAKKAAAAHKALEGVTLCQIETAQDANVFVAIVDAAADVLVDYLNAVAEIIK